jgi:hypothetical protein
MRRLLPSAAFAGLLVLIAGVCDAAAQTPDAAAREACLALGDETPNLTIDPGAGGDTLVFTGNRSRDEPPSGRRRVIRITDPESPRSLASHDRLILAGLPADWIVVARGLDLIICQRAAPRAIVIERHFCGGPLSEVDVRNGEIEEITFIGGVTWLADDIMATAVSPRLPHELEEKIRSDLVDEITKGNIPAQDIDALIAKWRLVPMSRGLGRDVITAAERCRM